MDNPAPDYDLKESPEPVLDPWDLCRLQDRIHYAGSQTQVVRLGILLLVVAGAVIGAIRCVGFYDPRLETYEGAGIHFVSLLTGITGGLLQGGFTGLLIALPLALGYRRLRARQIRRELAPLPPREQAKVLFPYRNGDGDAARIADRLAQDLRLDHDPSELVPADAPEGRGSELSAGEL